MGEPVRRIEVDSLVVFINGLVKRLLLRLPIPLGCQVGRLYLRPIEWWRRRSTSSLYQLPPDNRGENQQRDGIGHDREPAAPQGQLILFDQDLRLLLQLYLRGDVSLLTLIALDIFADAPLVFGDAAVDVDDLGFVEVVGAAGLPSLRQFQRRAGEQRPAVFVKALPFGDDDVELLAPEQEFTLFLNPSLQEWPVAQQVVAGELTGGLSRLCIALDCQQGRCAEIDQEALGGPVEFG